MYHFFSDVGLGVITPSRPNFGRTNLKDWKSPAEAAAGFVALMEELKIDSYAVYGISGGGPTACTLAMNYPDRVKCLVLDSALTGGLKVEGTDEVQSNSFKTMVTSPIMPRGMRLFYEKKPVDFVVHNMEKMSTHTKEEQRQMAKEILEDPRRKVICDAMADVFVGPALYPESYESWYNDMDNDQK